MTAVVSQTEKLLDEGKLLFLRDLGSSSPHFMPELLSAFVAGTKDCLAALQDTGITPVKVQHIGHKLKGMSGNIGAVCLERIASRIELSGINGKIGKLPQMVAEAERVFRESEALLVQFVKHDI